MKKSDITTCFSSLRKLTTTVLAFVIACGSFVFSSAADNGVTIRSNPVAAEVNEYALRILPKHLHALNTAEELKVSNNCYLGQAFEIYNIENHQSAAYYPVVYREKIIAILQVSKSAGKYNSILSVAFSRELEKLFLEGKTQYTLFTDSVKLYAYDGKTAKVIYTLNPSETNYAVRSVGDYEVATNTALSLKDLKTAVKSSERSAGMLLAPVPPYESNVLSIAGVSQQGETCWAATCAAIINYYKGTSLSDIDVARYIYGDSWNQGGYISDIEQVYKHWGLNYSITYGRIGFSRIRNNIDHGSPMDLGLTRHEVALIGYEAWNELYGGDRVLILLEPNDARRESVTLNDSGNFTYILNGKEKSWQETIEFS